MTVQSRETVQQPTESAVADAAETRWGIRKGIGVSLVSIFGLVVLVVGLLLAPVLAVAASTVAITVGLLAVAVALVVLGRWSSMDRYRRAVASSPRVLDRVRGDGRSDDFVPSAPKCELLSGPHRNKF